jgi:Raf kinase inhibitor-like YbhB/YbcL family protein
MAVRSAMQKVSTRDRLEEAGVNAITRIARAVSLRDRAISVVFSTLMIACTAIAQTSPQPAATPPRPVPSLLVLSTTAFADGATIPDKYASTTAVSPSLSWTGAPQGTQSFVLLMRDEEYAPGKRFDPYYHWILFNIPATATGLPEGVPGDKQLADGSIQPLNGRSPGYHGPGAPANGQPHHYTFTLYALDTKLDLGQDTTIAEITKAMDGHILDKGFLVGRFHKTQ